MREGSPGWAWTRPRPQVRAAEPSCLETRGVVAGGPPRPPGRSVSTPTWTPLPRPGPAVQPPHRGRSSCRAAVQRPRDPRRRYPCEPPTPRPARFLSLDAPRPRPWLPALRASHAPPPFAPLGFRVPPALQRPAGPRGGPTSGTPAPRLRSPRVSAAEAAPTLGPGGRAPRDIRSIRVGRPALTRTSPCPGSPTAVPAVFVAD